MYRLITGMVFIATLLGILKNSGNFIAAQILKYAENAVNVAQATYEIADESRLKRFAEKVRSSEFSELSDRVQAEKDSSAFDEYFGNDEDYQYVANLKATLGKVEDIFGVDSTFLVSCEGESCVYTATSEKDSYLLGQPVMFDGITNAEEKSSGFYTHVMEEDGGRKLVSWYSEPAGEGIYSICVLPLAELVTSILNIMKDMAVYLAVITVICAILGSLISRRRFAVPIVKLKQAAEAFRIANTAEGKAVPKKPDVHTHDEIEELGNSLYELEKSVIRTQEIMREESQEKGRIKAQLSIAYEIQSGALPREFPDHECFEIYGLMKPAREVGGDFYDFFLLDDNRNLVMIIGDVSDKGIPAALFMMAVKTMIRSVAGAEDDPARVLEIVNNTIINMNPVEMFVTVWIGILDLETGVLRAANAGHEYPILSVDGKPFEVCHDPHGLVIGALENIRYESYTLQLHKGDRLFVYSDGAPDALNAEGKANGLEGLLKMVRKASNLECVMEFVQDIRSQLEAYFSGTEQFDDITLLSVTCLGAKQNKSEETDGNAEAVQLQENMQE